MDETTRSASKAHAPTTSAKGELWAVKHSSLRIVHTSRCAGRKDPLNGEKPGRRIRNGMLFEPCGTMDPSLRTSSFYHEGGIFGKLGEI